MTLPTRVGYELYDAAVYYQTTEVWDGTVSECTVVIWHVDSAGTATSLGSATLEYDATQGAIQETTITIPTNKLIAWGDQIIAHFRITTAGDGTPSSGIINLHTVGVRYAKPE